MKIANSNPAGPFRVVIALQMVDANGKRPTGGTPPGPPAGTDTKGTVASARQSGTIHRATERFAKADWATCSILKTSVLFPPQGRSS